MDVINGNEKGTLLKEIQKFKSPEVLSKLKHNSVFLDYSTGDFYQFDVDKAQWVPKGNVGLHYSNALEKNENMVAGK